MKTSSVMNSTKFRLVCWTILIGGIAVAAVPPATGPKAKQGPAKMTRRSTDPPVRATGKLGQDLFLAIDHRDTAGVQALLKRGADPNARNGLEFTPLYMAAASHQPEVMQALLAAGAQPDAASTYGTPLTFAAATAHLEGANMLFAKGVDVNYSRGDSITPLIMACTTGSPDFVAELLKHKANVNAKDDSGSTALAYTARGGFAAAAQLLLGAGAKVDTTDAARQTPLMVAAMNGHTDVVDLLLQKGANPNSRDAKGQTPLILAVSYCDSPDVVKALVAHGAKVNAADAKGRTAAAIAVVRGHSHCAPLLGTPTSAALTAASTRRTPQTAARTSLKLLESSMLQFNRMANCISCHQDGLGRITTGAARDHGFSVDSSLNRVQKERIRSMLMALEPLHNGALKSPEVMKQIPLIEINEVNTTDCWVLTGMAAQHEAPTKESAAMALVLAKQQAPDGFWSFSLPRVPMQSSFFTFTALAVRAINTYAPKSAAAEVADRTKRAKGWLLNAPAQTSEDRANRLLGLQWAGSSKAEMQKAIAEIRADQRPDGGWAQVPNIPSDAYATGQALYALHVAGGLPVSDPIYKRGVQYLLRNQDADGSWYVSKRALPANNYFDAGFPHGESQYSSFNGTCWATLALLEALPRKSSHAGTK